MEKIKQFFSNKLYLGLIIGGVVLVVVGILLAVLLSGASGADLTGCTVEVKSEGGKALEGVGVYIYKDTAKTDIIDYVKTDDQGIAAISATVPAGSVAVLDKVPAGYVAEEAYEITAAETKIVLQIKLQEEMSQLALGDVMFDFTVTDVGGTEHTLSKLLETKKAVVINLWYINCQPCKAEFPYLIQAYGNYAEDIEVLAINPEGDSAEDIAAFVQEYGLTFPTIKGDAAWKDTIATLAYPTTIIIDRFGTVGLIHTGGIDSAKVFEDAFAYFVADGYVQSTVEKITDVATEGNLSGAGTKENPKEIAGVTEFEVTVPAGADYYCNLYRVSGMELTVESQTLKVTFAETAYESVEGIVKLQLPFTTDPSTPLTLCFTNTGAAEETYKVTLAYPVGAMENPLELTLGQVDVEVAEGNAQGFYLKYTAETEGNLTLKGLKKDSGYNVTLYNLTTSVQNTLEEDAVVDGSETVLSIPVAKGDEVQIVVTSVADNEGNYPAVSVSFTASVEQEGEEGGSGTGTGNGTTTGPNTNGTLVNPDAPVENYGFTDFSVEVGAGEKKLVHMIRTINEATLCLYDADAYVVYNGKTYTPSNGAIYIYMASDGSFMPMELQIGNSGTSKKTFDVYFYFAEGTRENPGTLNLGAMTTELKKGNDQGVYYSFNASTNGTLTIELTGITEGVTCDIVITSGDTSNGTEQATLSSSEDGKTVSLALHSGEKVIVQIVACPDKNFNYPKATVNTNISFS